MRGVLCYKLTPLGNELHGAFVFNGIVRCDTCAHYICKECGSMQRPQPSGMTTQTHLETSVGSKRIMQCHECT